MIRRRRRSRSRSRSRIVNRGKFIRGIVVLAVLAVAFMNVLSLANPRMAYSPIGGVLPVAGLSPGANSVVDGYVMSDEKIEGTGPKLKKISVLGKSYGLRGVINGDIPKAEGKYVLISASGLLKGAGSTLGKDAFVAVDAAKKIYENSTAVIKVYGAGSDLVSVDGKQFIRTSYGESEALAKVIVKPSDKGVQVYEVAKAADDKGNMALAAGAAVSMDSLNEGMDLAFVNKSVKLSEAYTRTLTTAGDVGIKSTSRYMELDAAIAESLKALWKDAAENKYKLLLVSAFRSIELQTQLFNQRIKEFEEEGNTTEQATALASQEVMPPGHSEHNTARSVDVVTETKSSLSDFVGSKEAEWIGDNAYKHGFIVRYPSDKTELTQIIFEPWHLRHVGVMYATYMKERDIILEEFYEQSRAGAIVSGGGLSAYFIATPKGNPVTVNGAMDSAKYRRYLMSDEYEGYEISLD